MGWRRQPVSVKAQTAVPQPLSRKKERGGVRGWGRAREREREGRGGKTAKNKQTGTTTTHQEGRRAYTERRALIGWRVTGANVAPTECERKTQSVRKQGREKDERANDRAG